MATLSVKSRADCLEALVRSPRFAVSLLSNIRYRMFSGSDVEEEKSSHFGFQAVSEKDKTQKVYRVFENVASSYDKMNDVMSFGIHRLWKDRLVRVLNPPAGTKLLDVAGGTGDIAFRFLNHVKSKKLPQSKVKSGSTDSHVTVCDINKAMLDVGQKRAQTFHHSSGISWIQGNAEELPLSSGSFDAYTVAFGIRNVTRMEKVCFFFFFFWVSMLQPVFEISGGSGVKKPVKALDLDQVVLSSISIAIIVNLTSIVLIRFRTTRPCPATYPRSQGKT